MRAVTGLTLDFAPDHPTGAGHFPGNPIIPGALLLAEVLRTITEANGLAFTSCTIKSAKFQHPVRPGDSVEIEYTVSAQEQIAFSCTVAGKTVLTGAASATINA